MFLPFSFIPDRLHPDGKVPMCGVVYPSSEDLLGNTYFVHAELTNKSKTREN